MADVKTAKLVGQHPKPTSCPHCNRGFYAEWGIDLLCDDENHSWKVQSVCCPLCHKIIVFLIGTAKNPRYEDNIHKCVYPASSPRSEPHTAVPEQHASDYREAAAVLDLSPKASAALSRRCLQHVLREKAGVTNGSLDREIQQVIDSQAVPSHITESIDAVRQVGNLAAHPIKSGSTGDVVEVEPGEAEWLLDTLDTVFDYYFVQPEVVQQKRAALDKKLVDAGKPPLKSGN